jgi:hypothetical protein
MFKLKDLLDGIVDDLIELPIMWVRTHISFFTRGPLATFRLADGGNDTNRLLKIGTAAFCDLLLIYALMQASNAQEAFSHSLFTTILQPEKISLGEGAFISLIGLFFAFYYVSYAVAVVARVRAVAARVIASGFLLSSILCVGFLLTTFLALFGSGGILAKDFVLRGASYAFAVIAFWPLGLIAAARLRLRRRIKSQWLAGAIGTVLCVAMYAAILGCIFGRELLWPDFKA